MTAPVWPDPDPGWRVRMGAGLLIYTPLSDEQRALHDRDAARERLQDEAATKLADESKFETDAERDWYMQRHGLEKRTVADVLEQASVAQDRQDRRDRVAEERAAVQLGHPPPRRPSSTALLAATKAEREAREAVAAATPASQAELGRAVAKLKNSVQNTIGRWLP